MLSEELKNKINKKLQHIMYDLIYKDTADFFIEEIINVIQNSNLIELPCKIGDKVYIIAKPLVENEYKIYCRTINRIEVGDNNEIFYYFDCHTLSFQGDYRLTGLDYNKTWFADKSLAEQKLEEIKNENR